MVNMKGVNATAEQCRNRYHSVVNYYRNNHKKAKGASYPFKQRVVELNPLIDASIPATEPLLPLVAPAAGCSRRRKRPRRGQPAAPADDDHLTADEFRAGVKTLQDDFQRAVQQISNANAAAAAATAAAAPAPAPPAPPIVIVVQHNAPLAPQNIAPAPLALADFGAPPAAVDFDFPPNNLLFDDIGFLPDLPLPPPPPEEIPMEDYVL